MDDLNKTAAEVIGLLKERHTMVAFAESCTGGLIAQTVTGIPGASEVFPGGIVSYANTAKMELLHVSPDTLRNYGAVSEECASEMVAGAANAFHADCAVSVTGIAGPGGGTPEKPVGTVCIGVKCFEKTLIRKYLFSGTREEIRMQTAATGLDTLRRMLLGETL